MTYYDIAPPYTPSPPSPSYSSELLPGERTVEFTRRVSSLPPAGVYRRITDRLTLVLREQGPGNVYPIYGRGGVIRGEVLFVNTADLMSVAVKLEAHFVLRASGVPVSATFFSKTRLLWAASGSQHCPRSLPFELGFPLTFDDGGQPRALPPTFENDQPYAAVSYSLTIELSYPRRLLSMWKGNDALKVPLIYRPRSRPYLPMLSSDFPFMSTVKSSPEEWHEIMCTLSMTQGSGLAPVEILLFIPSGQTYALSDTIPFHLQIRGSSASLVPFLEQGKEGDRSSKWSGGVAIRVSLQRHYGARIHGQSSTACYSLGEGKLEPSQTLTSSHCTFVRHPLGDGLDSLDWDGVLRGGEGVTVPSFFTSQFFVKDFIVLSVAPRQPLRSPLLGVTHSHPIRLVTDPWSNDAVT